MPCWFFNLEYRLKNNIKFHFKTKEKKVTEAEDFLGINIQVAIRSMHIDFSSSQMAWPSREDQTGFSPLLETKYLFIFVNISVSHDEMLLRLKCPFFHSASVTQPTVRSRDRLHDNLLYCHL